MRVTVLGWVLLGSLMATAVLAVVAPGAALIAAIVLARSPLRRRFPTASALR